MNSEKCENGPDTSNGRSKIRVAAATELNGLDQLSSAKPGGEEALDVEVARIAHKKLGPQEDDLVVQHRRDDLARLLIKIRRGEVRYDLAVKFLQPNNGLPRETEAPDL
jgi:hypothetical protein